MPRTKLSLATTTLAAILTSNLAMAHTPVCACYDNGDGSVLCEGGFSDGSSAAGINVEVRDEKGKVLLQGSMNEDSEFEFDKPGTQYTVMFDAGPGHEIEISSADIVE